MAVSLSDTSNPTKYVTIIPRDLLVNNFPIQILGSLAQDRNHPIFIEYLDLPIGSRH